MRDGAAEAWVTLVTVVPVEGLAEGSLAELSRRWGDLESGAEFGTEAVRVGQAAADIGRSVTSSRNASVLLDRRLFWSMFRLRC